MKILHVDNYPEILKWVKENLSSTTYAVYKHSIAIYCNDTLHRKRIRESINAVRTKNRYEYYEFVTRRWNLIPKDRKNQLVDRYGYKTRIRDESDRK